MAVKLLFGILGLELSDYALCHTVYMRTAARVRL